MTPLRLLNGCLLTIPYDYLVTTQKLLTDYTLCLLCVWLMPPLKTLVETMQIFYISELLIMFSLWMLQGLCFLWLISECLGQLCEDFLSMLWLLYVTILYPVVDVFFQAEIVGMSDFRRRGPVAIAELPAQHDNQDSASEHTQATHLPGLVRQSDWGDLRPEFTQVTKGAYVGQKPVSLCQGDVCPWSIPGTDWALVWCSVRNI